MFHYRKTKFWTLTLAVTNELPTICRTHNIENECWENALICYEWADRDLCVIKSKLNPSEHTRRYHRCARALSPLFGYKSISLIQSSRSRWTVLFVFGSNTGAKAVNVLSFSWVLGSACYIVCYNGLVSENLKGPAGGRGGDEQKHSAQQRLQQDKEGTTTPVELDKFFFSSFTLSFTYADLLAFL